MGCALTCDSCIAEAWTRNAAAMPSASMSAVTLQACSTSIAAVSPVSSVRLSSPASLGGVRLNVAHSASFSRYVYLYDHFGKFLEDCLLSVVVSCRKHGLCRRL